jgi:hypothetical protein
MFKEQPNLLAPLHPYHNNISSNNRVIKQQLHKKELKKKMMEKMIKMFRELIILLIIQIYR